MGNLIQNQHDGSLVNGIIDVRWLEKQDLIWEILEWVDKHLENMREKES